MSSSKNPYAPKSKPSICLVSCVSVKADTPMPARHLYQSPLFKKSVQWIDTQSFDDWYILSAKYKLIHPDIEIAPYNTTLNKMTIKDRRLWTHSVLRQLRPLVAGGANVTFLAGLKYREGLMRPLKNLGCNVRVPMKGLGIGQQLQWLTNEVKS